ncbi:DUF2786 domain-containing protein [Nocardiopsis metallicus]|uniref:DUF2786 domain-containing protein n=1 Tax=Nocardiopsis metallicus TaxID=179819 RepID=A0A840WJL2_9ACTN|nr:DUF2786 domain-containing protein [Nocardiopsis metallicus]MBB5495663.1 hypothetical protein [Nocardiopsis metallicus]
MGKTNRDRRRAKQKKVREQQRRRRSSRQDGQFGTLSEREMVLAVIRSALAHCDCGQCPDNPLAEAASLLAQETEPQWLRAVDKTLFGELVDAVGRVWPRGWQPAELVRLTRRASTPQAAHLVTDMVIAENRHHAEARTAPEWAAQVRELGEQWWGTGADHAALFTEKHGLTRQAYIESALQALEFLDGLPEIQVLLPIPGTARPAPEQARSQADPGKLARIRALLAKAEATEFQEEAEALSERAQQMMVRHSIDYAALEAEQGTVTEVGGRRLPLDAPYEDLKAMLLDIVAQANHCRAVWHKHLGMCTVMGFPNDVNMVELLFTSLLVQATTAMRRAGTVRDSGGRSRTRSFRTSFLLAFNERIGERLAESAGAEERKAVDEYARAGTDLLPVLASRETKVEEAVAEAFPELESAQVRRVSSWRGWSAGRSAADAASLHKGERIQAG